VSDDVQMALVAVFIVGLLLNLAAVRWGQTGSDVIGRAASAEWHARLGSGR